MVVDGADHRVQLDVRARQAGVGAQEGAALRAVAGQRPGPVAHVFGQALAHIHRAGGGNAEQRGVVALVAEHQVRVVLQVLADAGQFVAHGDAVGADLGLRADPGQHQQLRAAEGAGAQQHLAARLQLHALALDRHLHAGGALALQDDALGAGAGHHGEVAVQLADRLEEGRGGAPAAAVADGHVIGADAFLLGAVEVGVVVVAGALRRLDEGTGGGMLLRPADVQLAIAAVEFAAAAMVLLALAEVRQHLVVGPAGIAQLRPVVVVAAVAADVDHAVDRAAAAQRLAARLVAAAPAEARLRNGVEGPVDVFGRQDGGDAERRVDQRGSVLRAGFQQADPHGRIGAQAVGEDAAGGAGANDDVVEFHDCCSRLR
ncbi:hypothetical protein D3C76_814570 [compost metagenome]